MIMNLATKEAIILIETISVFLFSAREIMGSGPAAPCWVDWLQYYGHHSQQPF